MNMHATDNLQHYPLPATLEQHLRVVDGVAQRMARQGQDVDSDIVLSGNDYAVVDQIVRSMSGHRYNAATVQWNGRPLRSLACAAAA